MTCRQTTHFPILLSLSESGECVTEYSAPQWGQKKVPPSRIGLVRGMPAPPWSGAICAPKKITSSAVPLYSRYLTTSTSNVLLCGRKMRYAQKRLSAAISTGNQQLRRAAAPIAQSVHSASPKRGLPAYPLSRVVWTAHTVFFHLPRAIPRSDEAINFSGDGRIAKNIGMISRINSHQAARDHKSALAPIIVPCPRRRSGAENAQGNNGCNHGESLPSAHDRSPFLLSDAACFQH